MDRAQRCAFIIFGITGDLGARKLLPALYALHRNGRLHPETAIIGYARSDHTDGSLRAKLEKSLRTVRPGLRQEELGTPRPANPLHQRWLRRRRWLRHPPQPPEGHRP